MRYEKLTIIGMIILIGIIPLILSVADLGTGVINEAIASL